MVIVGTVERLLFEFVWLMCVFMISEVKWLFLSKESGGRDLFQTSYQTIPQNRLHLSVTPKYASLFV